MRILRSKTAIALLTRVLLPIVAICIFLAFVEGASWLLLKVLGPGKDPSVRFHTEDVWDHLGNPFLQPDSKIFWRPVAGYERGPIRIDRAGFRGPEVTLAKPAGAYRIALLGNSVTFGYLLPEDETYAGQLAEMLNAPAETGARAGGRHAEVIDAGVPGYTSWQGRVLLSEKLLAYHPDALIVMFGYNDHHSAVMSDLAKYSARNLHGPLDRFRRTALFRLVERLRNRGAARLPESPVPRVSLDEFRENILAIQQSAAKAGVACVFLTVPVRADRPLVENFRRIDFTDQPVWMRQIDFVAGSLPEAARPLIEQIFLGDANPDSLDLDPLCGPIASLREEFPDLPMVRYLVAACLRRAGSLVEASRELRESVSLDTERVELEGYNNTLRELARSGRIEIIDIAREFAADTHQRLFMDVVHPTPAGHELIALDLEAWVRGHIRR